MVTIQKGNLIDLTFEGKFDVIAHGCNCQCVMGAGIAPQFAKHFGADMFKMEHEDYAGDINKLGTIDYEVRFISQDQVVNNPLSRVLNQTHDINSDHCVYVVNCYTQYSPRAANEKYGIPLDYESLTSCMKKINQIFKGSKIGLPWIGCGLAGGDKGKVLGIIESELTDCEVTIVEL